MDVSTIGFLRADRRRLRILETLNSKSGATKKHASHKLRINQEQTDATIKELQEKGLIKEDNGRYLITGEGMKVLAQVSRTGM